MTSRRLALMSLPLLSLMILSACGSSEPTATPTPEPVAQDSVDLSGGEDQYLEAIASIDRKFRDVLVSIGEALSTTWPTRERLLDVLGEADVSGKLEDAHQQAEQLSPPESLRPDHSLYMRFMEEAGGHIRDHDQAVQAGDLVSVFVRRAHAFVARGKMIRAVSPAFCDALTRDPPGGGPPHRSFCNGEGGELPGGEYGTALHAIFEQYASEFNPRVSSFSPAFTPEELYASLAILNPEIETMIEEARDMVMALAPPAELRADHDRVILYLEENLELAREISQAARDQDGAELRTDLFPESGIVLCNAQRELSDAIRPLVAPFFGDEVPELCR